MRNAEHHSPRRSTRTLWLACLAGPVLTACSPSHPPATGSWLVESPATPGHNAVIVDDRGTTRWIYQTPGGAVIIDDRGETEIIVPTQPPQPRG